MPYRIYLDTSVYNRPFDDQSQPRIWLETLAFSVILQMIIQEVLLLISSSVVAYETSRNPHPLRREWVREVSDLAQARQQLTPKIHQRAQALEGANIKALDALHIACAEAAEAAYFITVDDKLIRRYQGLDQEKQVLIVCDPTHFVRIIGEKYDSPNN